jgi:hypothetical protein
MHLDMIAREDQSRSEEKSRKLVHCEKEFGITAP